MAQLKICGLMRPEDVLLCCACGVDLIGFVVCYPKPVPWNLDIPRAQNLLSYCSGKSRSVVVTGGTPEQILRRAENAASRLRAAPLPGNARGDASPCGGTPRNGNRLYQSHSRTVRRHAGYARLCDSCMHGLTLRANGRRPSSSGRALSFRPGVGPAPFWTPRFTAAWRRVPVFPSFWRAD